MAHAIALSPAVAASLPGDSGAPVPGLRRPGRTPCGRTAGAWDDLTPVQRRSVVAAMVLLHGGAAAWLLMLPAHAPSTVTPPRMLSVEWIAAPAPIVEPARPAQPAPEPPKPQTARPVVAPPERLIAAPEAAAPTAVVTPPPAPLPVIDSPPAPPEPTVVPAPASPVAPKTLPPEAVQYLLPPVPVYPKWSRRQGESGRVLVKVYVDESGTPRLVQVVESSGHPRLDEAARVAVQAARFKPYAENGRPTAGWAFVPLTFDLEK